MRRYRRKSTKKRRRRRKRRTRKNKGGENGDTFSTLAQLKHLLETHDQYQNGKITIDVRIPQPSPSVQRGEYHQADQESTDYIVLRIPNYEHISEGYHKENYSFEWFSQLIEGDYLVNLSIVGGDGGPDAEAYPELEYRQSGGKKKGGKRRRTRKRRTRRKSTKKRRRRRRTRRKKGAGSTTVGKYVITTNTVKGVKPGVRMAYAIDKTYSKDYAKHCEGHSLSLYPNSPTWRKGAIRDCKETVKSFSNRVFKTFRSSRG